MPVVFTHHDLITTSVVIFSTVFINSGRKARCLMRSIANNSGYMVKPHGQLVLVSSTPHNASTPSLSTS